MLLGWKTIVQNGNLRNVQLIEIALFFNIKTVAKKQKHIDMD